MTSSQSPRERPQSTVPRTAPVNTRFDVSGPPATGSPAPDANSVESAPLTWRAYAAVFIAGIAFFALNLDFTLSGDSALYIDYALNAKFDEITVHYGYYRVIWALDRTIGAALHIPIHELVAYLNVVCGALTLPVALALGRAVLRASRYALLAVAIFAVSGRTVLNAAMGEIYMLQTLLVLSSFLLYVRGRLYGAAAVAGLAMHISPLSVFAYLFFVVYDSQQHGRVRVGVALRVAGVALLVYLPFLVVHGREMLFGLRGLLVIPNILPTSPTELMANFPRYQFKHYTVLLLLGIPALFAWRREKDLYALTLAVLVPHFYVISKLVSEDNVFILNTDFLFCCSLAAGARQMARISWGKYVAPALLVAHVAIMARTDTFFRFDSRRRESAELAMIARTYLEGKRAALITDWNQSITVPYFGRPSLRGPVMLDPLSSKMVDVTSNPIVHQRLWVAEIYVLETWTPSGLSKLFRNDAQMTAIKEQNSWRRWAKEQAGLDCGELLHRGIYELYRCRGTAKRGPMTPVHY